MIHPAQKYKISVSYNYQNMFKMSKIYFKSIFAKLKPIFPKANEVQSRRSRFLYIKSTKNAFSSSTIFFFGHQMSVLVAFYISANQNLFLLCKWRTLLRRVTHILKKLSHSIIILYTENHQNSLVLCVSNSCTSF